MVTKRNNRYTISIAIMAVIVWIPFVRWFVDGARGPEIYTIESTRAELIGRLDSLSGYDLKRSFADIDSAGVYIFIDGSPCLNRGAVDGQLISSIYCWNDTIKPRLIRAGEKPDEYGCPEIQLIITINEDEDKLIYYAYFLVPFSEFYQETTTISLQAVDVLGADGGSYDINSSQLPMDENRRLKRIFEDSVLNKLNVKWEDQRIWSFIGSLHL